MRTLEDVVFGGVASFGDLQDVAREWVEELVKEFEESVRLKHINSICAISAKVDWIKHFFNLEEKIL